MQDQCLPYKHKRCVDAYVEEGEEVEEGGGDDVPPRVVERFAGMPWPEEVPFGLGSPV